MWLEHYQKTILNEGIQKLDLSLLLHNTLYTIQLLSCMFHFSIEYENVLGQGSLLIEEDIGVGNVSITNEEFLYHLQFNVLDDIDKELISCRKNYEDLENEINCEFKKITGTVFDPTFECGVFDRRIINSKELWDYFVEKYFPKWEEKNISPGSMERYDVKNIVYNYYYKELKIIEQNKVDLQLFIKKISNDYENTLKYITIYLKLIK
tara:strand:- start:535 stop:1158 length:624 start_codon:yes stop_codon:yes gene_type:complete